MEATKTMNNLKKTSLVKNAAWSAVLEATLVVISIIMFIKNQMVFTA